MIQKKPKVSGWLRRIIFLTGILIALGAVSLGVAVTLCGAKIPSISIDEPILSFAGDSDYDTRMLMLKAEQVVADRVWLVASAGTGYFTSTTYHCQQTDCRISRMDIEVGAQRHIACFDTLESFGTATEFIFDMDKGYVRAETYSGYGVHALSDKQIRSLSPTIEEALSRALDMVHQNFLNQNSEIEAVINKRETHWAIEIIGTAGHQIQYEIPFES